MPNEVFKQPAFTQPAQTCLNNSDFALALVLAAALSPGSFLVCRGCPSSTCEFTSSTWAYNSRGRHFQNAGIISRNLNNSKGFWASTPSTRVIHCDSEQRHPQHEDAHQQDWGRSLLIIGTPRQDVGLGRGGLRKHSRMRQGASARGVRS
jgi:hypothetical protein